MMWDHEGDGKIGPSLELLEIFADQPEGQGGISPMNRDERLGQERRDNQPGARLARLKCARKERFDSAYFQFDVEKCLLSVSFEHFRKRGQGQQLIPGRTSNFHTPQVWRMPGGIMADDGFAVGRAADIELKPVATMLQCEVKRREGVLRDTADRTCASMTEQKRMVHPAILRAGYWCGRICGDYGTFVGHGN